MLLQKMNSTLQSFTSSLHKQSNDHKNNINNERQSFDNQCSQIMHKQDIQRDSPQAIILNHLQKNDSNKNILFQMIESILLQPQIKKSQQEQKAVDVSDTINIAINKGEEKRQDYVVVYDDQEVIQSDVVQFKGQSREKMKVEQYQCKIIKVESQLYEQKINYIKNQQQQTKKVHNQQIIKTNIQKEQGRKTHIYNAFINKDIIIQQQNIYSQKDNKTNVHINHINHPNNNKAQGIIKKTHLSYKSTDQPSFNNLQKKEQFIDDREKKINNKKVGFKAACQGSQGNKENNIQTTQKSNKDMNKNMNNKDNSRQNKPSKSNRPISRCEDEQPNINSKTSIKLVNSNKNSLPSLKKPTLSSKQQSLQPSLKTSLSSIKPSLKSSINIYRQKIHKSSPYTFQNQQGQLLMYKQLQISTQRQQLKQFQIFNLIKHLSHTNLLKYYQLHKKMTEMGRPILLSLHQYYPYSLEDYIQNGMNGYMIKVVMFQVVKVVNYLHRYKIYHRCILPRNVGVSQKGQVKLYNFNMVYYQKLKYVEKQGNSCNNPQFKQNRFIRPPQLLLNNHYTQSQSTDIWQIGCLLIFLLTKKMPFNQYSDSNLLLQMIQMLGLPSKSYLKQINFNNNKIFIFPQFHTISFKKRFKCEDELLINMLERIMVYNPKERVRAVDLLKDQYFDELRQRYIKQVMEINSNIDKNGKFDHLDNDGIKMKDLFYFKEDELQEEDRRQIIPKIENKKNIEFINLD